MNDLFIKCGTIIDGTGGDRFHGDISVTDGSITGDGNQLGQAKRVVVADGTLANPGFIDVHIHYDGPVTWAPSLTTSIFYGVTPAIFAFCGIVFAAVMQPHNSYLNNLLHV